MPADPVLTTYQIKLKQIEAGVESACAAQSLSLMALVAMLALMPLLFYNSAQRRLPLWWAALPLPLAMGAGRLYGVNRDRWSRFLRLRNFYERGTARIEGDWHGNGFTGDEFRVANHVYDVDLQILGSGSLFELMCTARTALGRRRLAEYLLAPCTIAEARDRQESVRELRSQGDLRERVAVLGKYDLQESTWEVFSAWLAIPAEATPNWVRLTAFFGSVALGALVTIGFVSTIPWSVLAPWIALFLAMRVGITWRFRKRTNSVNDAARRVGVELSIVREGIELVANLTFRSAKMNDLQHRLRAGNPLPALRQLVWMTDVLSQCDKPEFELAAQVLNVRTQICFAIEEWKLRHAAHLEKWLDAWAECESLVSISGYAAEHPDDAFPEFDEAGTSFRAANLGHPLIPERICVRNDVSLESGRPFYIISGSNMSGKSTLLRSIGLNAVLANAGAPVRASSLRLTRLEVFASLSIADSVLEGKSKFYAEVERIKRTLDRARHAPVLFLIDEILSGTNSRDRRIASESIVRTLVSNGAIGALSTHDLALTEIAELEGLAGSNIHMASRPGDDPMDFDYLLKPGVTTETNALAIAAMMGVPLVHPVLELS